MPITLGVEELGFLLHDLDLSALLGLEDNPLGRRPLEERAACLESAFNSLRARGLLRWDPAGFAVVDSTLSSMLRVCVGGKVCLVVTWRGPEVDGPTLVYCHLGEDGWVLHDSPEFGLHRFSAGSTPDDALRRLLAAVAPEDPGAAAVGSFEASARTLEEVGALQAGGERGAAISVLVGLGASEALADEFLSAREAPRASGALLRHDFATGATAAPAARHLVLAGSRSLWLMALEADRGGDTRVGIESLSIADLERRLRACLPSVGVA